MLLVCQAPVRQIAENPLPLSSVGDLSKYLPIMGREPVRLLLQSSRRNGPFLARGLASLLLSFFMKIQTQTTWWAKRESLVGMIAAALFWVTPSPGLAQDAASIVDGRREFLQYCAVCHGTNGKGKGPMAAQLGIQPADLTQLSKKNGGEFPFSSTYQFIDGREEVKEKGPRAMPIWGAEFHKEAGSDNPEAETRVRERILRLVYYLQSIQKD